MPRWIEEDIFPRLDRITKLIKCLGDILTRSATTDISDDDCSEFFGDVSDGSLGVGLGDDG